MKTIKTLLSILLLVALFSINSYGQDDKEKWSLVTAQGKVTAINKDTREITLMGPQGQLVTVTASDAVKRFNEISVGDTVTFDYYTYVKAEFRQPTPEELDEPLVVLVEGGKAPKGMDPAAVIGAEVKAVVTVEILNRPAMLATVKGPRGNYTTIPMEDETLMSQLHIGQVVILTYTEAMALSLEKVEND